MDTDAKAGREPSPFEGNPIALRTEQRWHDDGFERADAPGRMQYRQDKIDQAVRDTFDEDSLPPGRFYLLACLGGCEPPLPMPFDSAAERGRWAARHRDGTGHDTWRVWEEDR